MFFVKLNLLFFWWLCLLTLAMKDLSIYLFMVLKNRKHCYILQLCNSIRRHVKKMLLGDLAFLFFFSMQYQVYGDANKVK